MNKDLYVHRDRIYDHLAKNKVKSYFKPDYSKYSIVNVPSLIMEHFNINSSKPLSDKFTKSFLEGCEQVILILIDGFGYNLALEHLKDITFKKIEQNSLLIPITSTFPSTTTTALSSISTGKTPQEHGVVGHTMYSQKFGTVVNMMRFRSVIESHSDSLIRAGFNPETYIRFPTIYETLSNEGYVSNVLTKWIYKNSSLSRMLHKGATMNTYVTSSDLFVILRKIINSGNSNFTFAYWDSLDTIEHAYGTYTDESFAELKNIFHLFLTELIYKIDKQQQKKTCIMITGDHGLVNVPSTGKLLANDYPLLTDNLIRPPCGDSRASFLRVKNNKKTEVKNYMKKFNNKLDVFETDYLVKKGFFGKCKINGEIKEAIGDLTVLSRPGINFQYKFKNDQLPKLKGYHGGLTEEELLVPFIMLRPHDVIHSNV